MACWSRGLCIRSSVSEGASGVNSLAPSVSVWRGNGFTLQWKHSDRFKRLPAVVPTDQRSLITPQPLDLRARHSCAALSSQRRPNITCWFTNNFCSVAHYSTCCTAVSVGFCLFLWTLNIVHLQHLRCLGGTFYQRVRWTEFHDGFIHLHCRFDGLRWILYDIICVYSSFRGLIHGLFCHGG